MCCVPTCTRRLFVGRLLHRLGQLELAPVGQRLLAVDVLAGVQGIDGLRGVMAVGRGDTDDVDVFVGQQGLVFHVHLRPAGRAAGGLQAGPVNVAHGHRLGNALLLEAAHDLQVLLGAAADADEAHADAVVGALDAIVGQDQRGGQGGGARGSCPALQEFTTR